MTSENLHGHEDHEQEYETINLTLDDGSEMTCVVIDIFEIDNQEYIALLHPTDETALLYRYSEIDEDNVDLANIESDEEFEKVSKYMDTLFKED